MNWSCLLSIVLARGIPLEMFLLLLAATFLLFGVAWGVMWLINEGRHRHARRRVEKVYRDHRKKYEAQKVLSDQAMYSLAVAIIKADGKIEPEELVVGEAIGKKLFDGFNSNKFRQMCNGSEIKVNVKRVAKDVGKILTDDGKKMMLTFLYQICMADGELHAKERKVLGTVAAVWGIEAPSPEPQGELALSDLMYALTAIVITADGVVEEVELQRASELAGHFVEDFKLEELRQACIEPSELPDPEKLAVILNEYLTDDGKQLIGSYIMLVAESAEENREVGMSVVEKVCSVWQIDVSDVTSESN